MSEEQTLLGELGVPESDSAVVMHRRCGPPPIKARIADAVFTVLDHACAWTRHLGGCWILTRSPLRKAFWWSNEHGTDAWRNCRWGWPIATTAGDDVDVEVWRASAEHTEQGEER